MTVSGDTAAVGAPGRLIVGAAGAAYVFQRGQGGADNWGQVTKLTASDAQAGDGFGGGVAVSGGTAIVGALGEDAGGSAAGAAYVFERDEGGANNWGEVAKLTASDGQADDNFGASVAVRDDTAAVGAPGRLIVGAAGAAYVLRRGQGGAGNWGQVTKLTASDAQTNDHFGFSVTVSGDTVIVGAFLEDPGGMSDAGAAYIYDALHDEQININVLGKLSGSKLEGNCWRISYINIDPLYPVPVKIPHDVVGDDVAGVKPDCGEPSNVKLFDKDPSAGNLRITITSAQRVQFGDIWHAQMSFSPIGGLDPANYRCDLSLGKCTIGPVSVGGLVVDLDEGSQPAAQPSGTSASQLASTVAAIAAGTVALGGAAWYARRRG